jgi:hypothetical protein
MACTEATAAGLRNNGSYLRRYALVMGNDLNEIRLTLVVSRGMLNHAQYFGYLPDIH